MWQYEKKLQYPVNIKDPNPALAKVIISQLGGPDGELGAALRYLNQRSKVLIVPVLGRFLMIYSIKEAPGNLFPSQVLQYAQTAPLVMINRMVWAISSCTCTKLFWIFRHILLPLSFYRTLV